MIHVPSWFYVFTGLVLAASGSLQVILRRSAGGVSFGTWILFALQLVLGFSVVYFGLFIHH
jgi:hypothetical protein